MSAVSVHLSNRTIESHVAPVRIDEVSLTELKPGHSGIIVDVCNDANPAAARRLFDLGFAPGAHITVVRRAPMADPVVFRVAGYEVALRRAQARCIQVSAAA